MTFSEDILTTYLVVCYGKGDEYRMACHVSAIKGIHHHCHLPHLAIAPASTFGHCLLSAHELSSHLHVAMALEGLVLATKDSLIGTSTVHRL